MESYHRQTSSWNIVGHEHSIDILRRTLAVQQVRHAYLFTGPQHIGKTLLALLEETASERLAPATWVAPIAGGLLISYAFIMAVNGLARNRQ